MTDQKQPETRPLKLIVCLPGTQFSHNFLMCWSQFIMDCTKNGIQFLISCQQGSNINILRSKCLGANVLKGKAQKPFDGMEYDYILWIDSDQTFTFDQFKKLLSAELDVNSGVYLMHNGTHYCAVKDWDDEFFKKNGSYEFLTPIELKGINKPIKVVYNGMGFMLIKKGVFEKLEYPWFKHVEVNFGEGIVDITSEDVGFCRRVAELGINIHIDPSVRVGHEKTTIL